MSEILQQYIGGCLTLYALPKKIQIQFVSIRNNINMKKSFI